MPDEKTIYRGGTIDTPVTIIEEPISDGSPSYAVTAVDDALESRRFEVVDRKGAFALAKAFEENTI